jgi:hypothetical protein
MSTVLGHEVAAAGAAEAVHVLTPSLASPSTPIH